VVEGALSVQFSWSLVLLWESDEREVVDRAEPCTHTHARTHTHTHTHTHTYKTNKQQDELIPVDGNTAENGIKGDSTADSLARLKPAFVKVAS
jgi:hypothetical protein